MIMGSRNVHLNSFEFNANKKIAVYGFHTTQCHRIGTPNPISEIDLIDV